VSGSTVSFTGAGTCTVDADQAGNTDYQAAPTATQNVSVGQGSTSFTITVNGGTSATIASGATATLAEPGLPAEATGTVTFMSGTSTLCVATLPTTSCTTSATLPAAAYPSISATFVDTDGNYSGSTSTNSVSLTVSPSGASTTTKLTSTATVTYGAEGSATFHVNVTSGAGTPTGTVAVRSGTTTLCTVTLGTAGIGTCTLTVSQLSAGTYPLTAVYTPGNVKFAPSTSAAHSLVVKAASTTTTLTLTTPVAYGAEGSANFAVAMSSKAGAPAGTVAVRSGTTTLCTVTLGATGTGTCTLTATQLAAGTYWLTAVYKPGSANYAMSTSAAQSMVVNKAGTTTTLTSTTPVSYGAEGSADFAVTVRSAAGMPTGTVAVRRGTSWLCTVTLGAAGTGTCTVTATQLAAGTYWLTAVYKPGRANYAMSTSPSQSLVVNQAGTAITPQPVRVTGTGSTRTVRFTAKLTSTVTRLPISGQRLTFRLDTTGNPTCSAATNASGAATCRVSVSLTADNAAQGYVMTYAGNADYLSSTAPEPES
jgi:hypothetical protein